MGVDLQSIKGSGPGGRISKEDLLQATDGEEIGQRASGSRVASESDVEVVPLRGVRRSVARNLTLSWTTVPHVTSLRQVEAGALVDARDELARALEQEGVRVTYVPFFVMAAAQALRRFPMLNASLDMDAEEIRIHRHINIGVAVAAEAGLVVTVLHDADQMSFREIAVTLDARVKDAREGRMKPEHTTGGTFTVSNGGAYGGWLGTPIIRPPESAIVTFGAVQDAVIPVNGEPAVRAVLPISVSADHRLIDGRDLSLFAQDMGGALGNPIRLLSGGA